MDFYKKYLKYKNKYEQLKEFLFQKGNGKGQKGTKETSEGREVAKAERVAAMEKVQKDKLAKLKKMKTEVSEDEQVLAEAVFKETKLMEYIKKGNVDILTLSRDYGEYEEDRNTMDGEHNYPLYVYINLSKSIDMDIISFLLPDEVLFKNKNIEGDTIMHLVVKKNDVKLLEYLWSKGGRNAKLVVNKAGLNLLKLAQRLLSGDKDKYQNITNFLKFVYNDENDESVDSMLLDREHRRKMIESSGFKTSSPKATSPKEETVVESPISKNKVSSQSLIESMINFDEDFSKNTTYFVFGKKDIEKYISLGIVFETLYIDTSINEPKSTSIVKIKKIDMNNAIDNKELLLSILTKFDGVIGLVAKQSREFYDTQN